MDNMNREKKKDMFTIKLVAVIGLLAIVTGTITFGFFSPTREQTGSNTLVSGCFNVTFTENTSSINLTNTYAISDEKGQATNPYSFTIQNTCDTEAAYHILLNSKEGSFDDSHINVSIDAGIPKSLSSYNENVVYSKDEGYATSHILKSGSLKNGESATFEIRAWINAQTAYEDVAGKNWQGQVKVVSDVKALRTIVDDIIASSNGVKTNFDEPATTDEGVFEMEDDYGTSYYYRGAVENNYVKFAGFYWRIIRVNGDGSLRIIYDGTQAWPNGNGAKTFTTSGTDRFTHTMQKYNANYNDNKYVGWMYGPAGTTASTSKEEAQTNTTSSDIKTAVDSWYKTNIADKGYGSAVADVIFCNDRSTPGIDNTGWSKDTGLGYGKNATAYGALTKYGWSGTPRYDNPEPQFTCPEKNDAFTVSDTNKGNGDLTYPVGLITGDEIVAAGSGKYNTINRNYYLYKTSNYFYWSISPCYWYVDANMSVVDSNGGQLYSVTVYATSGSVAPVINLSADYVKNMVGIGTITDPYASK